MRSRALAFGSAAVLIAVASVCGSTAAGADPGTPVKYVPLYSATTPTPPDFAMDAAVAPSACATDVTPYVTAAGGPGVAVTSAFERAMSDALVSNRSCFPAGPSGAPQAVVYVPPGVYLVNQLQFPSNVRLEVDAGATLQLPPNVYPRLGASLVLWETRAQGAAPVDNVSVVGVGSAIDARKQALLDQQDPYLAPFNLGAYFTMNLDPASTGSTNLNAGVILGNVTHFLIQNVLAVQNDSDQAYVRRKTPWPTSSKPVLAMRANQFSPIGGPFIQPMHGSVNGLVTVHSPRGFGADQVNGATDVSFHDVYSSGGTALRLESDDAVKPNGTVVKGATIDGIVAENIVAENCNRTVSFAPHGQLNGSAIVSGVWSNSCYEGVAANDDLKMATTARGRFTDVRVDRLYTNGGTSAQLDSKTKLWDAGTSYMTVYVNPQLGWSPQITLYEETGTWTNG